MSPTTTVPGSGVLPARNPGHGARDLVDAPADYVLGGVTAVLPDAVVDDARVVVRSGRVVEVGPAPRGARPDLHGGGALLLPGLVDVHTDVLGHEVRPRPGARLPVPLAVRTATARLAAGGILTAFHGVAYGERTPVGLPAGEPEPREVLAALADDAARADGARALHRLDVRCPAAVAELRAVLDEAASGPERDGPGGVPLVSHEDHTPGIGQYARPATMERWLVERAGMSADVAYDHVARWRTDREARADVGAATLDWLGGLARAGRVRLAGHDPETTADVEALVARGGAVAEFPTTVEAARAARAAGLVVVAGAPNAVRGGSHAANVSARELVALGLVDALASDYVPSAMLAAVDVLVRERLATLPAAVALVTSGPVRAAGLTDRGALVPGARADLVLVRSRGGWSSVAATLRAASGPGSPGPDAAPSETGRRTTGQRSVHASGKPGRSSPPNFA
ncbi:alpha-D-ribose 1-methylphosphonate 5-triphosphate diphosphatase [Cellulosimicrobium cellulans]|uniref:Alpha-D-ribose 1-methylphosphonate 5-triphosphate diphosphatase n=1 Tax=Cellulosimicrobium cellulans TaxID=1710 RepID=A0A1Y0HTP4_CELCE|nr:alpha-D-ribose 1-methylphosphonate 5-triphosphate diphosphatase [Cellulosimicrobium cellulans]ARU51548.1 alpha-D-ribose 1-methylphosphonate 5-triphosphate diphosphatase [Cellulosimicrobium cellulans]